MSDHAPQPPNPPSRYKGRCDVHGLRTCDECQFGETDAKLLAAAEARIAALEATIEADRTRIIDGVNAVEKVVNEKFWLTQGRGSYEWNDDRYRKEFGEAVRSMLKAVEPLRKIGADLTNCPQTTAEVVKARADKDAKIAALREQLKKCEESK